MTKQANNPPAVGEPLVRQVLLCDIYRRDARMPPTLSTSLPGHLIQLTREGSTHHDVGGRAYMLEAGHLIWYHENEMVRTNIHKAPWSFYTLNFIAPALTPPPFDRRVVKASQPVKQHFAYLLSAWRDTTVSPAERHLNVHAAINALLASIMTTLNTHRGEPFETHAPARLWWELESRLRENLAAPIDLPTMARLTGKSQATIARACHAAVGQPPMKRVKHIRMSMARELVLRSPASITEIATRLGYDRLHEFSRDYHKHFGHPPTAERRKRTITHRAT